LVWHFYQIFFDPDTYPMNWAWWDGKMSEHHYREEHGLDGATLFAAEAEAESGHSEEAKESPVAEETSDAIHK
jgi:hypothetical protein